MIKIKDLITTPSLEYHIKHGLNLSDNVYRYSSDSFISLFSEARQAVRDGIIQLNENDSQIMEESDLGEYGEYEGKKVPLDLPMVSEAEYQGKKVQLGKPKRGGPKKFYVYVKNDKGKIVKVNFGGTTGLTVKLKDPKRRKAFSDRHNCPAKKDKTKPGYWACRTGRYWKSLGGDKNYPGFW